MGAVIWSVFLFFFQAEDGIRDLTVTGVQTCALPICRERSRLRRERAGRGCGWRRRWRSRLRNRGAGRRGLEGRRASWRCNRGRGGSWGCSQDTTRGSKSNDRGLEERGDPPPVFSEVLILKGFKCCVLEVRIPKGLRVGFSEVRILKELVTGDA